MSEMLEKLRNHFNKWQAQGHETKPDWYDDFIDCKINVLTNVELVELIDLLNEEESKDGTE